MDIFLVPAHEIQQILQDIERFVDQGVWSDLFGVMKQLTDILNDEEN